MYSVSLQIDALSGHSVVSTVSIGLQPCSIASHSLVELLQGTARVESAVASDLESRSYTLLRTDIGTMRMLREAEAQLGTFFALPLLQKQEFAGRGELGGACGFNSWPLREQWHARIAEPGEPWPLAAKLELALFDVAQLLRRTGLRCLEVLKSHAATSSAADSFDRLHAACTAVERAHRSDVLDGFRYAAREEGGSSSSSAAAVEAMGTHTDPGIFTIKRTSDVAGVELQGERGEWVPIERLASPEDLVVFAADQLQAAASCEGSRVRAVHHRVMVPAGRERTSLLYELRAPSSVAAASCCRHGRRTDQCHVCQYYPVG